MKLNSEELESALHLIELAIREDVGEGDITTDKLIPGETRKSAFMVTKADGIIAGLEVAELVFRKLDGELTWNPLVRDGERVNKGDIIVKFSASYRALLTGERTALNFLQRMSGIATAAGLYSGILSDSKTKILDTRKTIPGFRLLDKYAVRAGGGVNHRMGLYDMVMIKDNHIAVAGGIRKAVETIRPGLPAPIKIEVEAASLLQVEEAVDAGADIIMLDNMDTQTMRRAVEFINGRALTEASGNMVPERLREVADTGVDFISAGALTHSVKALDISQEIASE